MADSKVIRIPAQVYNEVIHFLSLRIAASGKPLSIADVIHESISEYLNRRREEQANDDHEEEK